MGLIRLLILILVVALVLRWVLRKLNPPAPRIKEEEYQKLTRCEVCGTHIVGPVDGQRAICERCRSR